MKITWLGHSAFRIETGESVILIDPFLTSNPSFNGSYEDVIAGCTHVVLSHGHDDHIGDTVDICQKTGARLVAIFEICMFLNARGFENIDPANTGGCLAQDDFSVTFTQALHSSGTVVNDASVYLGNPCGLVIKTSEGKTLYHMGDTDIFGDMALINEMHAPDIGIVPIGDRFTMGAKSAALACKRYFSFSTVFPCHYATFEMLDQTADAFVAEMAGQNVVVPQVGESVEV